MIDQDIKQRMDELPIGYRDFINSGFATEAASVLGSVENLSLEQVKIFESSVLLYLLFFVEKRDIVQILINEGVSDKAATSLVFALEESLPDFAKQGEESLLETDSVSDLETEIATTEHDLASLQNVRTMSHDMEVAQGHPVMQVPTAGTTYQSSQADILRPTAPAAVVNEAPRWDTE